MVGTGLTGFFYKICKKQHNFACYEDGFYS